MALLYLTRHALRRLALNGQVRPGYRPLRQPRYEELVSVPIEFVVEGTLAYSSATVARCSARGVYQDLRRPKISTTLTNPPAVPPPVIRLGFFQSQSKFLCRLALE